VRNQKTNSRQLITAIFWDSFSVASAANTLSLQGVSDSAIDTVGVLAGSTSDLSPFLASLGIPECDATYYNDCFEDGAVLLLVRARPCEHRTAIDIIQKHGGMLPPSHPLHVVAGQ
jgi:hypothetical protein